MPSASSYCFPVCIFVSSLVGFLLLYSCMSCIRCYCSPVFILSQLLNADASTPFVCNLVAFLFVLFVLGFIYIYFTYIHLSFQKVYLFHVCFCLICAVSVVIAGQSLLFTSFYGSSVFSFLNVLVAVVCFTLSPIFIVNLSVCLSVSSYSFSVGLSFYRLFLPIS